jgi:hypothetical protein
MYPPSTTYNVSPVFQELEIETYHRMSLNKRRFTTAENRQASAISCGVPILFIGAMAIATSSAALKAPSPCVIGVLYLSAPISDLRGAGTYAMTPGHTQLILKLSFEYFTTSTRYPILLEETLTSIASLFVIDMTAALEAQYAATNSHFRVQ